MATDRVADIPLIALDTSDSFALVKHTWPMTHALMADVLKTHWALPVAVTLGDGLSRRWLKRRNNPYLPEIERIASALGRRGGYFFNIVYEWGCSTSVAPDPAGVGARMLRVLDWELRDMGHHTVIAQQRGPAGPYYNVTWPGYSGVVTGMAPGRFAAAINQGPRHIAFRNFWLNEAAARFAMLRAPRNAIPATHLLRRAFETAPDFSAAVTQLMDTNQPVATPALFVLSGVRPDEGAIVEATGRERRCARMGADVLGVANAWLSKDLEGAALPPAHEWQDKVTADEDSARRRAGICALQRGAFAGAASLAPPVLNSRTVCVAEMNAATGHMAVETLDRNDGDVLPRVVARGRVGDAKAESR